MQYISLSITMQYISLSIQNLHRLSWFCRQLHRFSSISGSRHQHVYTNNHKKFPDTQCIYTIQHQWAYIYSSIYQSICMIYISHQRIYIYNQSSLSLQTIFTVAELQCSTQQSRVDLGFYSNGQRFTSTQRKRNEPSTHSTQASTWLCLHEQSLLTSNFSTKHDAPRSK